MGYTPQKIGSDQIPTDATFTPESWKDSNLKAYSDYSGAVDVKYNIIHVATVSDVSNITLEDGAVGQRIVFKMIAHDGIHNCVLTPDNFRDGTTITFDSANDSVELYFDGTSWNVIGTANATIA